MKVILLLATWAICSLTTNGQVEYATDGDLRLRGGQRATEGRVEVYLNDQWGTLSVTKDLKGAAQTVCKQLGYFLNLNDESTPYGTVRQLGFQPADSGVLSLLKNVRCKYHSSRGDAIQHILRCDYDDGNLPPADHLDDFAVKCATTPDPPYTPYDTEIRLVQSLTGYSSSGYVEIYLHGSWGPVCNMGYDDADAACRQLGYSLGFPGTASNYAGNGTNKLNIFTCQILDDTACLRDCFSYPPEGYTPSCPNGHSTISCDYDKDPLFFERSSGSQSICDPQISVGLAVGLTIFFLVMLAATVVCVVVGCFFIPGCYAYDQRKSRRGPTYGLV